jgi:capsular polysaccharide biosynthesis protein
MTDQNIHECQEDEVSLLDILLIMAEAWRILIFGPIIAGVLAGGLSYLWPKTYQSIAIVRTTEENVAQIYSPTVLDTIIGELKMIPDRGANMENIREALKVNLKYVSDNKTKLITIMARAQTPEDAHTLLSSAMKAWLQEFEKSGREKDKLKRIIDINNKTIDNLQDLLESMSRKLKREDSIQIKEQAIRNYAFFINEINRLEKENEELKNKINPIDVEVVVKAPVIQQQKILPNRSTVVLYAMFASFFLILIYIFIRKAWISSLKNTETAKKIAGIKSAFTLKMV